MRDTIFVSLIVSFLYGVSPILHKIIFNNNTIHYYTLLCITSLIFFVCSIFIYISNYKIINNNISLFSRKTILLIIIGAILSTFIANLLYFKVIQYSKSYLVSALIFSSPFFTLLLSLIFLDETINMMSFIGVSLIITGTIILSMYQK